MKIKETLLGKNCALDIGLVTMSLLAFSPKSLAQNNFQKIPLSSGIRQTINVNSPYCLGSDVKLRTGLHLSQLQDLQIQFNGESVRLEKGNFLRVLDSNGINIQSGGDSELPYYPSDIFVAVKRTKNDICISSEALGILRDISLVYRVGGGPVGPQPPFPPPPPPQPPQPPLPPPPPPPQSRVEGNLVTVRPGGLIAGWACDSISQRNVEVRIYVNSRLEETLLADRDTTWSSDMGHPSFACRSSSGFSTQINLPHLDEGGTLEIRAVARSPITGQDTTIGQSTLRLPVLRLGMGIFSVGRDIYFSDGDIGTYCHIPTMDLVRIIGSYGYRNQAVNELPRLMSSRGTCEPLPIKEGLFQKMSGPEIYYSNGVDAYCYLTHPDQIQGRPHPRLVDVLPAHMRFDGDCH